MDFEDPVTIFLNTWSKIRAIQKVRIKTNPLLYGTEKTLSLEEAVEQKQAFEVLGKTIETAGDSGIKAAAKIASVSEEEVKQDFADLQSGLAANIASVSEEQVKEIYSAFGASGLYKLFYLIYSHGYSEFKYFFHRMIASWLPTRRLISRNEGVELECDNDMLPQGKGLAKLNLNVIHPSLSRKFYNPGRHPGYLVHGLGGPRILVSHPFRGVGAEEYDVYTNAMDVVTSLWLQGYDGTFLLPDYLPGLNFKLQGVSAWLLCFSIIAIHSDLVLFIKEEGDDFSQAQKMEIGFTPDRVQKKIVEFARGELRWAKDYKKDDDLSRIYIDKGEELTKEEYYRREAKHANELFELYTGWNIPQDRLIRVDESGGISVYPLDYPMYGYALRTSHPQRRSWWHRWFGG